jgi:hypothetical protein
METASDVRERKRQRLIGRIEQATHGVSRLKDLDRKFELALVLLAVAELKKIRAESSIPGIEPPPETDPGVEAEEASKLFAYVQWQLDELAKTPAEKMVMLHKIVRNWLDDGVTDFYSRLSYEEMHREDLIYGSHKRMEEIPLVSRTNDVGEKM